MRRNSALTPFRSNVRQQSSRNLTGPAPFPPGLITRFPGSAAGLGIHERHDVAEPVADRGPVDATERAADVHASFVLQHLHAATANGGVNVLIYPRPWNRRHLRQVDRLRSVAHFTTAPSSGALQL